MLRAASSLSSSSLSSSLSLLSSLLLLLLLVLLLVLVLVRVVVVVVLVVVVVVIVVVVVVVVVVVIFVVVVVVVVVIVVIAVAAWSCYRCRCYLCSWYFLQTPQNRQIDGFCKPPDWLRGELGLLFRARPAGQSVLIPAGRLGVCMSYVRPAGRLDSV